ncbi:MULTISPECIES: hypothetical protein [unclassified Streptomyces]|uniref:hypothetical protein n=1 Tax=unclassified Streptomyces TaxID=2593676 RepID=UPI00109EB895|nr:hypothetical protein [Streptomyces sp. A1136]THA52932.1 hypothetical protein E6R62_19955 [Streptomyces sp. A1136]
MSADELDPRDVWPLPPAWMFDCSDCFRLYRSMKRIERVTEEMWLTGRRGVDWDPVDNGPGSRIRLARHLATSHESLLPDWLPECRRCGDHERRLARADDPEFGLAAAMVAAEHRAAHLFVPPRGLGLV